MIIQNFFSRCNVLGCLAISTMLIAQTPAPPAAEPLSESAKLVKDAQKLTSDGKLDEALSTYSKAVESSPKDADAHLGMGVVLDLQGNYPAARKHLSEALALATGNVKERALRTMAFSYAFECNVKEAARYEQQAFDARMGSQDFAGAAGIANELGRLYLECGDLGQAEHWYKTGYQTSTKKTGMSEGDQNLWLFRWTHAQGRIAARRGDKETAQKYVEASKKALDNAKNPDQARFLPYLTGYVAYYAHDYKTAIADLQQADQGDPFILCLLAQAYEKSGDKERATEHYKKVMAVNSHGPTNAFARPLARKKLGSKI